MHTRPPSADPQGTPDRDGAYSVRSVPVRVYLPDGPVMQDIVPPLLEDGESSSIGLSDILPATKDNIRLNFSVALLWCFRCTDRALTQISSKFRCRLRHVDPDTYLPSLLRRFPKHSR